MAFCTRCGKKLGLIERLGDSLCDACEGDAKTERDAARKRYGETVDGLAAGTIPASDAVRVLQETTPTAALPSSDVARLHGRALLAFFDRALADDIVTLAEDQQLEALTEALGLTPDDLASIDKTLLYRWVIAQVNDGRMPEFPQDQATLTPKKGEIVHLEVQASLMKEVTKREYVGGYGGLSFRIAKGVRFSTGRVRGRSVEVGKELQTEDVGILSVSSHRSAFLGERKTLDMPHAKLLSLGVFEDGVRFNVSNRQRAPLLTVDSGELVAAVVNAAAQRLEA
jgi:hypothetical protein